MKLYTALSFVGITLGALGFAAQGCSSDDDNNPPTTTPDGGGDTNAGRPPAPPTGAGAADTSQSKTFAVSALFLGDSDRSFVASNKAWESYGYNIDGKATTATSTDVCTAAAGAAPSAKADGPNGIDNSFGSQIVQLLGTLVPQMSKTISDSITNSGAFTLLMTVNGLTDDPKQSATGLTGDIRFGANLGAAPAFGPALDWPYRDEAPIPLTGAYINDGTFVNGEGGSTVKIVLSIAGNNLEVVIEKATVTFEHSSPDELTNGVISGVVKTTSLIDSIGKVAGSIGTGFCPGSATFTSISELLTKSSDILQSGANTQGVPCDAISVGIGFTAKRVGPPTTKAEPEAPQPDPCNPNNADAGTDAGNTDAGTDAGDDGGQQ